MAANNFRGCVTGYGLEDNRHHCDSGRAGRGVVESGDGDVVGLQGGRRRVHGWSPLVARHGTEAASSRIDRWHCADVMSGPMERTGRTAVLMLSWW